MTVLRGVSQAEKKEKVSRAVCSKMSECLFVETLHRLWITLLAAWYLASSNLLYENACRSIYYRIELRLVE